MRSLEPPPSYEASSYRRLWPIVAAYFEPQDLLSACLVSHHWSDACAPHLWGNPAARFRGDVDEIHLSLARFRHALRHVRLSVRSLTHTFEFSEPSFGVRVSEVVRNHWLKELLDQLPALHCLILSSGSLIGHKQLLAVHQSPEDPVPYTRLYPLRLLDLSNNVNLTVESITAVLQHFPDLIYLDLSSWTGVRNQSVLRQIGTLSNLKVLRLSRCGLKNEDMKSIELPASLSSLDVSFCWLSHFGLDILFEKLPQHDYRAPSRRILPRVSNREREAKLFTGDLSKFISKALHQQRDIDIQLDLPQYFCELNVQGNEITLEDIVRTFGTATTDHLDCGTLSMYRSKSVPIAGASELLYHPRIGSQQLNAALFTRAFAFLRSLRIHHSLITDYLFKDGIDGGSQTNDSGSDEGGSSVKEDFTTPSSSTSSLTNLRKGFTESRTKKLARRPIARFQPSMLPNLKILTLLDMPTKTTMTSTTQSLYTLIQELAEEENLARLDHLRLSQSPDNPPNWSLCPKQPLKLRTLIIEMSAEEARANGRHNQDSFQASIAKNLTRSSVEDPDAETFVRASERDFSFFRSEESDSSVGSMRQERKVKRSPAQTVHQKSRGMWVEVIPAVAKFRKESRERWEGSQEEFGRLFSGHWIGEIKVYRKV